MKQLSLLFLLLFLSFAGYSQYTAANYGFSASSAPFVSIAATGNIPTVGGSPGFAADDVISDDINIGFNFDFAGVTYTDLVAGSNGWIMLGSTGGSSLNGNDLGNLPGTAFLFPLWDDLNGTAFGSAFYTTDGVAPNRRFIFEWIGFQRFGSPASPPGSQDFQVILHETSNVIEYAYTHGSMTANNSSIGIASSTSDYLNLPDHSAAPSASATTFYSNLVGSPADGQLYTWTPPAYCSGMPTAGTAFSDVPNACSTDNINLHATGISPVPGLGFQWQSSADGITWSDIAGGTSMAYTTTETADNYYRIKVTCISTGDFDTSATVFVPLSPVCYCSSFMYGSFDAGEYGNSMNIFRVDGYLGSVINDAGPVVAPQSGYENRSDISVDMQQGGVYNAVISYNNTPATYMDQVWIDFNDDGIFDITEEVTPVISAGCYVDPTADVFTINIPLTAPTGTHRMRVRYVNTDYSCGLSTDVDPCNSYDASGANYQYGTTRDYSVNIIDLSACTGMPTAGDAASSVTLGCPATPFTLSDATASVATDYTYQWQQNTGAGYTGISGATTATYSYTESFPAYYQLVITCPSSGLSATSTPVFVNYIGTCYCVPSYTESPASSGEGINMFDLTGYGGSAINDGGPLPEPTTGYEDQTALAAVDLQQGEAYNGDLSYHDTWENYESQVWIDFNDDGAFDASEEVTQVIYSLPYASSDVFTLNIPIAAPVGIHRMRVRYASLDYDAPLSAHMDPCNATDASNTYHYGMTRDYMANILAAPACAGMPTGGVAAASVTMGCPGTPFTLTATGVTAAAGLTYQWQSSATLTGTYAPITGATTITYSYTEAAPAYYHLSVTCTATGDVASSTPVFVNYVGICYCTPAYTNFPASYSDGIDIFNLAGYSGSLIGDAGPVPAPLTGYEDRTAISIDLQQGTAYAGNLSYVNTEHSYETQIWIDFDNDGNFSAAEEVSPVIYTGTYAPSSNFTLTVPMTAALGLHRMRVRYATLDYDSSQSAHMDPCNPSEVSNTYFYGMTRDYTANIILLPPCTGTPAPGAASITPTSGGASVPFTLSMPGLVPAAGFTYQWQSGPSATGPWTDIAGATNATYSFTSIFADTWFQSVVVCTLSTSTAISTPVLATYVATPPCFPDGSSWGNSYDVSNFGIDAVSVTGYSSTLLNDAGITGVIDPSTAYLDQTALPPVTMAQGGVYPISVNWINSYSSTNHQAVQVWIDFNDNGVFETTEEVSPVSGFVTTGSTPNPTNFYITIPAGATVGNHHMRVRGIIEDTYTSTVPGHLDPCNVSYLGMDPNYYTGDAIDYLVNIVVPCPFTAIAANNGPVCPYSPISLTGTSTAPNYSWTGPDGFTSTQASPVAPGIAGTSTYTLVASSSTCSLTAVTTVSTLLAPPAFTVTPAIGSICNGGTLTITATVAPALLNLIPAEDFEAGVPTIPGTLVDGWNTTASDPGYITQVSTGNNPPAGPQSGSHFAFFNSYSISSLPDRAALISPSFDMTGITGGTISFWVYRDDYNYLMADDASYATEGWNIWINTSDDITTATNLGFVPRPYDAPVTGSIVGSSLPPVGGWYQYTVTIPATFSGSTNNIFFEGITAHGDDTYLDNVTVTGYQPIAPPVWTPLTDLYSDVAATTAYVAGTPALSVYLHPTTVTTTATVGYVATTTNGTCTTSDTANITITAPPAIVAGGSTSICGGSSLSLSNPVTGGIWSSSNTTVATVGSNGVVHGITDGADTIFYNASGCTTFIVVHVSTFVTLNTGSNTVICGGGITTTLSNATPGGTWTSSNATVATVSPTGVVTSGAGGQAIITYTLTDGCSDTSLITSIAAPAAITGPSSLCYSGSTITLNEATTGGTWSTSAGTVATISSATGTTITVTGLTAGAATITYNLPPGCYVTHALTLNNNPPNITGNMSVCAAGGVTSLTDATGTWSSGTPARATVNSATGVVTGVTAGTAIITFTLANGCYDTALVTVNPLPAVITGTTTICNLTSTTLSDVSTPGTWSTTTPSVTTVDASGVVTALTAGTGTIIYTLTNTGCTRSATVTVNALPAAITGATNVCNSLTTTFSSTSTGTWTSNSTAVATVGLSSGIVTGTGVGTTTITLTNASSCYVTKSITVDPSFVPSVVLTPAPAGAVCAGTVVSYVPAVTNGGTAPAYVWSVNGVAMSAASSYTYTPANNDVVSVNVVSNMGCAVPISASSAITMVVNPILVPALTLATAYGDTGCMGVTTTVYTFPVDAGAGPTFQWYVNGSPVSAGTSYTYVATDGDVVGVTMTSTAGCLSGSTAVVTSATITLDIVPIITPVVTLASSTGSSIACPGEIVVYSTTATNGGLSPAYLWTINGVNVATGPAYHYVPANGDNVVVTMTSNYPCVSPAFDTAQMTMSIGTNVTPVATITAHPGTVVAAGMNDTFHVTLVSGGGAAPAYQWYINGVPVSGANAATFVTNTLSTGDLVTCHVTNTDPCGGTVISNVLAMTVGGGSTGISQAGVADAAIALVPNPNNGSFVVKGSLGLSIDEDMILEVLDMVGQVVYTGSTQARNGEFNEQIKLSGILANGMYVLNVRSQHMNKVFHFVLEQK